MKRRLESKSEYKPRPLTPLMKKEGEDTPERESPDLERQAYENDLEHRRGAYYLKNHPDASFPNTPNDAKARADEVRRDEKRRRVEKRASTNASNHGSSSSSSISSSRNSIKTIADIASAAVKDIAAVSVAKFRVTKQEIDKKKYDARQKAKKDALIKQWQKTLKTLKFNGGANRTATTSLRTLSCRKATKRRGSALWRAATASRTRRRRRRAM